MLPETVRPSQGPALEALRGKLRERAESFVGTLAMLHGTAELFDPLTGRPRPVDAGTRLGRGTRLTIKTGRALVRFDDGSDLWLAEGASVDLSPWNEGARALRLLAGRALALVARDAARPFRTLTGFGNILVTGTAFEVLATPAGLTVTVLHGSIEVANDHGRVRATRGRAVETNAADTAAPTVRRHRADVATLAWVSESLALSAQNTAVRPAYRAVARAAELPNPILEKLPMKKLAIAAAALLLLGGGSYVAMNDNDGARTPVPGPAHADGGAAANGLAGPAGKPLVKSESRMSIRLRGEDGVDIEVDPTDPKSVETALAKIPEDKRAELRKKLEDIASGKGPIRARKDGGVPHGIIESEVDAGMKTMKELMKQGMSKEEAQKIVSQGLSDSLKKQLVAQGEDPNVQVMVVPDMSIDGTEKRTGVMVMKSVDGSSPVLPPGTVPKFVKNPDGSVTVEVDTKAGGS